MAGTVQGPAPARVHKGLIPPRKHHEVPELEAVIPLAPQVLVEQPLDIFSLEKTNGYKGVYHVLHGVIDPLHNVGPDELYVGDLLARLRQGFGEVKEVILALNPTMEGEATAMYMAKQLKIKNLKLKVTRLGVGMPIGGDLQYADEMTLSRAMEGRREY